MNTLGSYRAVSSPEVDLTLDTGSSNHNKAITTGPPVVCLVVWLLEAYTSPRGALQSSWYPPHVQVATRPTIGVSTPAFRGVLADFGSAGSQAERLQLLVQYGSSLPHMALDSKITANRVMGCTTQACILANS